MATQWHYQSDGQELGPVSFRELVELVRTGALTEGDLVRPSWKSDWQHADTVVGLFHMAGKSADELTRLYSPGQPAVSEPPPAAALAELATVDPDPEAERPGWMTRLFSLTGLRKPSADGIPILGPPGAGSSAAPAQGVAGTAATAQPSSQGALSAELAEYYPPAANSGSSAWDSAVEHALQRVEERAAASRRPRGRFGRMRDRVSRALAAVRGTGNSSSFRPVFRLVCAFICANLVAFAIESWSAEEALRFPTVGSAAANRQFPLIGPCNYGEYLFFMFDAMLVTGAATWFAARWLDSHAE
jgi:hypothetical protein